MALSPTLFTSAKSDGTDTSRVQASYWNNLITVVGRLRSGVVDVRDYGAVGDGTTDDAAAIQAALTAVGAAGGGIVFLPAATYKVGTALAVPSKVTVAGAGRGATTLKGTAGALTSYNASGQAWGGVLVAAGVSHVCIRDLTVDLSTLGCDANGIELGYDGNGVETSYATVQDCRVLGKTGVHSYQIWNRRANHSRILRNIIDGNDSSPSAVDVDHTGIEVFGGSDVLILGNQVMNLNGVGIALYANALLSDADAVIVAENRVDNCSQGVGLVAGYVSSTAQNFTDVQVRGNVITTCPYACVHVACPANATIAALTILGNTLTDGQYLVHVSGVSGSVFRSVSIVGNVCERATTTNSGAFSVAYLTNALIADNIVATSVYRGIDASNLTDVRILGNTIEAATNIGMYVTVSSRLTIAGNRISEWDTATSTQPGIAGDGDNVSIRDNEFYRSTGTSVRAVLWNSGDRTSVSRNRLLWTSGGSTPFSNAATNPSIGTFTCSNLETNHSVTNTQATNNSYITVVQLAGTARALQKVTTGAGGFTVFFAAACDGTEQFKYEINQ